jgi:hypothetical protein
MNKILLVLILNNKITDHAKVSEKYKLIEIHIVLIF